MKLYFGCVLKRSRSERPVRYDMGLPQPVCAARRGAGPKTWPAGKRRGRGKGWPSRTPPRHACAKPGLPARETAAAPSTRVRPYATLRPAEHRGAVGRVLQRLLAEMRVALGYLRVRVAECCTFTRSAAALPRLGFLIVNRTGTTVYSRSPRAIELHASEYATHDVAACVSTMKGTAAT